MQLDTVCISVGFIWLPLEYLHYKKRPIGRDLIGFWRANSTANISGPISRLYLDWELPVNTAEPGQTGTSLMMGI